MKNFFKPEDFAFGCRSENEEAAQLANEKLNKLIESWPVVYGSDKRPLDGWNEKAYESTTHKARIAFIEELPKEPCKHEPSVLSCMDAYAHSSKCKHCGVGIVATWSAK